MSVLDVLQGLSSFTGAPGEVGAVVLLAFQVGRLVRRFDVLEKRVNRAEAQGHDNAQHLEQLRRIRGQRHA